MNSIIEWAFQSAFPSASNYTVGFEDVLQIISSSQGNAVIIHTLDEGDQSVLIKGTLTAKEEEQWMDKYLAGELTNEYTFLIYGRHSCDDGPRRKRNQLMSMGISDVYIYSGGLFEWLLLQDIYGEPEFPTRGEKPKDLLRYRCPKNQCNFIKRGV